MRTIATVKESHAVAVRYKEKTLYHNDMICMIHFETDEMLTPMLWILESLFVGGIAVIVSTTDIDMLCLRRSVRNVCQMPSRR